MYEVIVDGGGLLGVVFQGLYSEQFIPVLPQLIDEVEAGQEARFFRERIIGDVGDARKALSCASDNSCEAWSHAPNCCAEARRALALCPSFDPCL